MRERWINIAYLCRYAHQPITALIGRPPTPFEMSLLITATNHWIEQENAPLAKSVGDA